MAREKIVIENTTRSRERKWIEKTNAKFRITIIS